MISSDGIFNSSTAHPYHPAGVPVRGYVANSLPTPVLIAYFATGCACILSSTFFLIQKTKSKLSNGEVATALWFVLCGFIHLGFEGYFAFNFNHVSSLTDVFGQLWKEYSLSDSRYMTQNSFVVCMEAVTAIFWGPLSFLCAYYIVIDHPLRHSLQTIISLGQLYGDVLYYATCSFDSLFGNVVYCHPWRVYFWAYYVLMNAFWIVIPLHLLIRSAREISRAFAKVKMMEARVKKSCDCRE